MQNASMHGSRMQRLTEPCLLAQQVGHATHIVVDCLSLWLARWIFRLGRKLKQKEALALGWQAQEALILGALSTISSLLTQQAAQACEQVTLMLADLPLSVEP